MKDLREQELMNDQVALVGSEEAHKQQLYGYRAWIGWREKVDIDELPDMYFTSLDQLQE